jgi:hypothetical protein
VPAREKLAGTSDEEFGPEMPALWAKGFAREGRTAELAGYVDAGIPADLTDDKGDTLVMLAAYHGHAETVAALVERGADSNRENDRGQSPPAGAVGARRGEDIRQHGPAGPARTVTLRTPGWCPPRG